VCSLLQRFWLYVSPLSPQIREEEASERQAKASEKCYGMWRALPGWTSDHSSFMRGLDPLFLDICMHEGTTTLAIHCVLIPVEG
jgi:hypothetical protein